MSLVQAIAHSKGLLVTVLMSRGDHCAGHLDRLCVGPNLWFFTPGFAGEELIQQHDIEYNIVQKKIEHVAVGPL